MGIAGKEEVCIRGSGPTPRKVEDRVGGHITGARRHFGVRLVGWSPCGAGDRGDSTAQVDYSLRTLDLHPLETGISFHPYRTV